MACHRTICGTAFLLAVLSVLLLPGAAQALTTEYAEKEVEKLGLEYEELLMDLSDLEQELKSIIEPGTPLALRAEYVERILRLRKKLLQLETRRRELGGKVEDLPRAPPLLKLVRIETDLGEDYQINGAGWVSDTIGSICVAGGGFKCGGEPSEVRTLESFRIVKAPLEIRPTDAFTVVAQARKRTWYPEDHLCRVLSEGEERDNFVTTRIAAGGISALLRGERSLGSYCDEGSTRRVWGLTLSWLFKSATIRSDVATLTVNFIPLDKKVNNSGLQEFFYTATAGGGSKIRLSLDDQRSFYRTNLPTDERGYLRPDVDTYGGEGLNGMQISTRWMTLHYEPVRPGDPFMTSINAPSHPAEMLEPDQEGVVRAIHLVPDLAEMHLADAKRELAKRDLEYSLKPGSRAVTEEQDNTVEQQRPPAGQRIASGSTVTLTVRSPYVEVKGVPDLLGLKASAAKELLHRNGLGYTLHPGPPARSADQSQTIFKQVPAAGSQVEAGIEVALTVHSDFVDTGTVPDVYRLSYTDAKSRLEFAGFYIETREADRRPASRNQAGQAARQDPPAGTETVKGKTVLVWFFGQYTPTREEQVAAANCSTYSSSAAYWDDAAGEPRCGCFAPLQWNSNKTACVSQREVDQQICSRDYPGTVANRRASDNRLACNCPQGTSWISAQKRCLRQKTPQERVAEANCSAYPSSAAYWDDAAGEPRCGCFAPLQWNSNKTACVTRQTDQERCSSSYPGSVANGRKRDNTIICDCPQGWVWTRGKTACVRQTASTGGGNANNRGRECDFKIGETLNFMKAYRMDPQNGALFKIGAKSSASEARQMGCDPARINEALGTGGGNSGGRTGCPAGQVFQQAALGQGRCVPAGRTSSGSRGGCRWDWDVSSAARGYVCDCNGGIVNDSQCAHIPKPR